MTYLSAASKPFGILVCVPLFWSCISSCSNHASPKQSASSPDQQKDDLPPEVSASQVTYTVYGPAPAHKLYYQVYTDRVNANLGTGQLESGVTGNVSGTIYTKGPCTFKALSARGSKSSPKTKELDVLTLTGDVVVHDKNPAGDMYCDRLTIDMTTHIIKATGHVRFDTSGGIHGTMPEAWATQDLTRIASPELFQEGFGK